MRILLLALVLAGCSRAPAADYSADMSTARIAYRPPDSYAITPGLLPLAYRQCLARTAALDAEMLLAMCRPVLEAYVTDLDMPENRKPVLLRDLERSGMQLLATMPRPYAASPAPPSEPDIIVGPSRPAPGELRF